MTISANLLAELTELIRPLTEEAGLELLEIDLRQVQKRRILEIIIDKENGVTLDDCAELSRQVSLVLDVEDLIPFRYHLEVGSPGVFRELKTEAEIRRKLESRVKVELQTPLDGQKQIIGILKGYEEGVLFLSADQAELRVGLDRIKKIQLFPDI